MNVRKDIYSLASFPNVGLTVRAVHTKNYNCNDNFNNNNDGVLIDNNL